MDAMNEEKMRRKDQNGKITKTEMARFESSLEENLSQKTGHASKPLKYKGIFGGDGRIRTHGTVARTADFKSAALNRSATSPKKRYCNSGFGII